MKKIFCLLLIVFILMLTVFSISFAEVKDIFGEEPTPLLTTGSTTVSNILGALQWIGFAIAVGMLIIVGIKYVMSAADDKASLKTMAFRYIIGVLVIAGASTILAIIRAIV